MTMRSRWYHPPTLHTASSGEKKAGWLELFYDLVFVAAFIRLGDGLAQHWSLEGFVAFSAVFVPIWLAWIGFSYYANRFTIDDFTHRALVFGQMFAVGAMAIYAPDVLNGRPERFALSFAVAQAVVAGLYFRAWKHHEARDYSVYWGGVFAFGAVLWAVSVLCPPQVAYLLWAIAIGGILSSPIGRRSRTLEERYPIDHEHLSERFGLLTLIVLGESFVKVISNISPEMADMHVLGQAALTRSSPARSGGSTSTTWRAHGSSRRGSPRCSGSSPTSPRSSASRPLAWR
ncbi:MAG: low temperature requirement protein A [Myxococcales bacterium]|nr:low temperature requirement protein A [Myxococcales bacterium]